MITFFRNLFTPPRHMILLILATWIGISLAEKRAKRHGIHKDDISNITFYSLLGFIIGGRLSFVLQNIPTIIKKPSDIFSINVDLFDMLGAITAALLVGMIYSQRRNLSPWNLLDALVPLFSVLAISLGLSRLASGTSFGKETDLPWAINLWNAARHPTQIYEAFASLLIFGLLWFQKKNPHAGTYFLTFAALTAGAQLIVETFRADTTMIFGNLSQNQLVAWVILAISFLAIELRIKQTKRTD